MSLTDEQAQHMTAAAMHAHPQGELGGLHEKLRGRLNFPVEARLEALAVARASFRLREYYEARNSELPIIAELYDRAGKDMSTEPALAKLETYWRRMTSYLKALGPHPAPLMFHGPRNPAPWPSSPEEVAE